MLGRFLTRFSPLSSSSKESCALAASTTATLRATAAVVEVPRRRDGGGSGRLRARPSRSVASARVAAEVRCEALEVAAVAAAMRRRSLRWADGRGAGTGAPLRPLRPTRIVLPDAPFAQPVHRNSCRWNSSGTESVFLPGIERIILIRHGESAGNVDETEYSRTADWQIPLTELGRNQARSAGKSVSSILAAVGANGDNSDEDETCGRRGKVFFYVSPYLRTRQTLREILREVDRESVAGIREDPRVSEQQFGNLQSHADIQTNKAERTNFGRFYYRFPDGGESGFDVYCRVSGFIGSMSRDSHELRTRNAPTPREDDDGAATPTPGITLCIVTHGLTLRLFLMRWYQYTVHEFERSCNPDNGRVVVIENVGWKKEKHRRRRLGGGRLDEDGDDYGLEINDDDGGGEVDGEKRVYFELGEEDRIAMGFPLYLDQERFAFMDDFELLDRDEW